MLGVDRLCKDTDFYTRAKNIPLHCSEGIENHEANVSNTTNFYNHSRSEIPPDTISQSIGGIGVSPVQAQAKTCGYHKLSIDCNSV